MEFKLKVGSQGHVYFPKKIRELLGNEITLTPNTKVAVIYPKDADLTRIILSLKLIIEELNLQISTQFPTTKNEKSLANVI